MKQPIYKKKVILLKCLVRDLWKFVKNVSYLIHMVLRITKMIAYNSTLPVHLILILVMAPFCLRREKRKCSETLIFSQIIQYFLSQ